MYSGGALSASDHVCRIGRASALPRTVGAYLHDFQLRLTFKPTTEALGLGPTASPMVVNLDEIA